MKQRFSKRTRLVSALLTLAMVFTFLPFSAFAANTEIDFNSPDFQLDFPDAEFQRFLKERCDTNHNGKLDAQELSITEMTITDDYKIKNLEGIRFFEDLEKLDCHGIGLTTLNVGKNFKLRELDCSYNQLKDYLYILSSGLKILNCSHNNLTSMDLGILSGLKLEEVDCSYNKIWRIVMRSEEELIKFDCSNNELTALDVSRCYQLKQLNCSVNQLVELDVKNQTNLTLLDCHHNELIELNVSRNQNLASLTCDGNQLTTLDLSKNNSLSHLSCAENRLACVDFSHMVGSTINADGNRRPIAVRTDGKFDLATLPGFDVSKATNWTGGSVSDTTLSVNAGANEVSYQYNCGNDIFSTEESRQEQQREQVQQIPIGELFPFKNHPFKVLDDEFMQRTVESVEQYGVLSPLIARPRPEGGYEIISGHRRQHAAQLAGLDALPVIVRQMDDDAAVLLMVDSNLQRENILPSERAFAYKMKLEALKNQGARSDLTSVQVAPKLSTEKIGEEVGMSKDNVKRYIRLTNLVPELLDMVDEKKIAFNPAVELSYLDEAQQRDFLEAMNDTQNAPSLSQAQRLKKLAQEGHFSYDVAFAVMGEEKKDELDKVVIKNDTLRKYFPRSYTPKQMEDTIIKLLEQWQRKQQRQNER